MDEFGPPNFQRMTCTQMGSFVQLGSHGSHHLGMQMAEKECPVSHPVVNEFLAVDRPFPGSLCSLDIHWEGSHVADVVGDAARDELPRPLKEFRGRRMCLEIQCINAGRFVLHEVPSPFFRGTLNEKTSVK